MDFNNDSGTLSNIGAISSLTDTITFINTGALVLPSGNIAQRPTATAGEIRFNTEIGYAEAWSGNVWVPITTNLNILGGSIENGFVSRTDNTLSFDDLTRTLTNAPTAGSFEFWAGSTQFIKSTAQTVAIPDTEGIWFFYYNTAGVLTSSATFTQDIITTYAFCAEVYWDATNKTAIFLADERHGRNMPSAVHSYLHSTQHAKWASGLDMQSFSIDGTGNGAVNAQFSVADGVFYDEDIRFNITNNAPQQLAPFARIPVFYRSGNNLWRKAAASDYPVVYGVAGTNTRIVFNEKVGINWQLTEVDNNNFMMMHYFGTDDVNTPIIGIMGQAQYQTKAEAYEASQLELASINTSGLPTLEYVPIGTTIFETKNTFTNIPKARIRSINSISETYIDWRGTSVATILGVATTSQTSTSLDNLSDVTLTSSATNQVLTFNGTEWVNSTQVGLLPAGGTAGQVLIKNSATNYDASFGILTADQAPHAKQLLAAVKNDTLATILKGTPVYQSGSAGSSFTMLVGPADAANPVKMPAVGVLHEDLAPAQEGSMVVLGEIQGINTSTFAEGDLIFVGPGGGHTNVKPTAVGVAVQFLGVVTKIHATNGGGYITGTATVEEFRHDGSNVFSGWNGTQWTSIVGGASGNVILTGDITGTNSLGANVITTLANVGTAGTYATVTTDSKGRVVAGNTTQSWSTITNTPTTLAGYGITDSIPGSGTVTNVSVISANGLAGTVANSTSTPTITLSTTVTGLLKGNGTAISAATPGVDFVIPTVGSGVGLRQISKAVLAQSGTSSKITANTLPVYTDGVQIWFQSITPGAASSAFTVDGSFYIDHSSNNRRIVISVWRTVGAVNTLVGVSAGYVTASGNGGEIAISFYDSPATTSPITYSLRCWSDYSSGSGGTWYVAQGRTPVFGGALAAQIIRVTETS